MRESGQQECWRVSRIGRWGTGLAFGGLSAVALVDTVAQGRPWLEGLTVAALLTPLWLIFAVRPSLCLNGQEVVVRNPLWTHHIPLSSVAEVRPGYFGITIKRHGRSLPVTAWAVQETNTAMALNVDTRAKQAASRIMEAARPSLNAEAQPGEGGQRLPIGYVLAAASPGTPIHRLASSPLSAGPAPSTAA